MYPQTPAAWSMRDRKMVGTQHIFESIQNRRKSTKVLLFWHKQIQTPSELSTSDSYLKKKKASGAL